MKGTSPGSWLGGRGERDANRYVGGKKKVITLGTMCVYVLYLLGLGTGLVV